MNYYPQWSVVSQIVVVVDANHAIHVILRINCDLNLKESLLVMLFYLNLLEYCSSI